MGTAYVRLRVLSDTLSKDIAKSVNDSIKASDTEIKTSGEHVGEKITEGVEEKVSANAAKTGRKVADDIGNSIGTEMGKRFNSGIGVKLVSALDGMWSKVKNGTTTGVRDVGRVFDGFKSIFTRAEGDTRSLGGRLLGAFGTLFKDLGAKAKSGLSSAFQGLGSSGSGLKGWLDKAKTDVEKGGSGLLGSFGNLKNNLEKQTKDFKLGDIMAPLIGGLVTALPSAISFAGGIISSFVGFAVVGLSSLGPAIAGGALAGVAAMGTLKLSMGLVKLAMSGTSAEVKNFKKEMASFKEQAAKPIQEGLFSGLNAAMRISKPLIGALTPMLREFGYNVGDIAINFSRMLSSADNMNRLQRILTVNNDAVKMIGAGVVNLAHAFLVLFDHLSPVITYLASGAKDLSEWALNALAGAEASGKLDTFISKMFNSLTFFVGILVDFGKGIINIFHAAYGASGGMLTNLQGIAARFKDWTGSAAGQAKMLDFFQKARVVTDEVLTILGKITKAAGSGLGSMNVGSLVGGLKTLEGLGKPLADMFKTIRQNAGGAWQQAFVNFSKVIEQLAQAGVIGALAKAFSGLFLVISKVLAIPGMSQLLGLIAGLGALYKVTNLVLTPFKFLGPVIETLAPVFFDVEKGTGALKIIMQGLGWVLKSVLMPALEALVGFLGWPIIIIAALTAALVWFFTQTKIGRQIIETVWNAIKTAIGAAIGGIIVAFNWVVAVLGSVWTFIKGAAQGIWSALVGAFNAVVSGVSTAWNAVIGAITTAMKAVWNVITTVWGAIWGFIQPILQAIWNVISTVFNTIVTIVSTALNIIWAIFSNVMIALLIPVRILEGLLILAWQGIVAGITWAVNLISSVVSTVWGAIWGFIQMVMGWIAGVIVGAWNGIVAGVTAALNWVQGVITSVWNAIWGFLQPIIAAILGFIIGVWNAIASGISAAMNWIWGIITSVWGAVSGFIGGVMSTVHGVIVGAWDAVSGAISSAMSAIWGVITSVWNNITGFLSGAAHTIAGIFSGVWGALQGAGGAIVSGLKSAVNGLIGAVNTAISGLNWMIDVANKLPGVDLPHIQTIPQLAKGGVVSPVGGGTLAMIAEAGRPERVEPLDENGLSKRDHAILNLISNGSAGAAPNVRVFIGDTELTSIIRTEVDSSNRDTANALVTGRK